MRKGYHTTHIFLIMSPHHSVFTQYWSMYNKCLNDQLRKQTFCRGGEVRIPLTSVIAPHQLSSTNIYETGQNSLPYSMYKDLHVNYNDSQRRAISAVTTVSREVVMYTYMCAVGTSVTNIYHIAYRIAARTTWHRQNLHNYWSIECTGPF